MIYRERERLVTLAAGPGQATSLFPADPSRVLFAVASTSATAAMVSTASNFDSTTQGIEIGGIAGDRFQVFSMRDWLHFVNVEWFGLGNGGATNVTVFELFEDTGELSRAIIGEQGRKPITEMPKIARSYDEVKTDFARTIRNILAGRWRN